MFCLSAILYSFEQSKALYTYHANIFVSPWKTKNITHKILLDKHVDNQYKLRIFLVQHNERTIDNNSDSLKIETIETEEELFQPTIEYSNTTFSDYDTSVLKIIDLKYIKPLSIGITSLTINLADCKLTTTLEAKTENHLLKLSVIGD